MSRTRIPSDVEPAGRPFGKPRTPSAFRGFVDDIAVLFAIMVGRDMVQRYPKPEGPSRVETAPGPRLS